MVQPPFWVGQLWGATTAKPQLQFMRLRLIFPTTTPMLIGNARAAPPSPRLQQGLQQATDGLIKLAPITITRPGHEAIVTGTMSNQSSHST